MNISANSTGNTIPEWLYVEQVVYSGIVALIGIPGNILIILVFAYSKEKTTTDIMVFSMAISDLLGSTVCTTFNILGQIPSIWANIGSEVFCGAHDFFRLYTGTISSWILGAVACDRYLKICRPFSEMLNVPRTRKLCVIVYILVTGFCLPSPVFEHFDHSNGACLYIESESVWSIFIKVTFFLSGLSFIVTAIAYVRVAIALCTRLRKKYKRSQVVEVISDNTKIRSPYVNMEISSVPCTVNTSPVHHNDVIVSEKQTSVVDSTSSGKISKGRHRDGLLQEQRRVNQTTFIMFLITIINITVYVFVFVGDELAKNRLYIPGGASKVVGHTIRTIYLISFISNPLLYIVMSSKFRESVKRIFHRFKKS